MVMPAGGGGGGGGINEYRNTIIDATDQRGGACHIRLQEQRLPLLPLVPTQRERCLIERIHPTRRSVGVDVHAQVRQVAEELAVRLGGRQRRRPRHRPLGHAVGVRPPRVLPVRHRPPRQLQVLGQQHGHVNVQLLRALLRQPGEQGGLDLLLHRGPPTHAGGAGAGRRRRVLEEVVHSNLRVVQQGPEVGAGDVDVENLGHQVRHLDAVDGGEERLESHGVEHADVDRERDDVEPIAQREVLAPQPRPTPRSHSPKTKNNSLTCSKGGNSAKSLGKIKFARGGWVRR